MALFYRIRKVMCVKDLALSLIMLALVLGVFVNDERREGTGSAVSPLLVLLCRSCLIFTAALRTSMIPILKTRSLAAEVPSHSG